MKRSQHLLGVVLGAERLAVDRLGQDGLHRRGRLAQRIPCLKQRGNPQPGARAARLGQPGLLH